jgi:RND family efflux transporter MFP subunit
MTDIAKPASSRNRLMMLGLLALAAVAGAAAWQARGFGLTAVAPDAAAARPDERLLELAAMEVTRVVPRHLTDTVRLSGSVSPLEQSGVRSEVAARVAEVPVREGQAVRRGDVLARFDTADLAARLNEKLSNLEGARAQLELSEKQRAKSLALRQKDIVAESAFDQAQSTWQINLAQLAALNAQVEVARKALRDGVVVAPIDGTIAERAVNPGEMLAVNTPMFSIVDLRHVEIEATVPADEVARLKPGQPVRVRVEGFGDRPFAGTLVRINPVARRGTRAIPVHIDVENTDGALRGGMFAIGEAVVAEADNAIALPPAAVRHDADGDYVLTVADGRLVRRAVRPGPSWGHGDLRQTDGLAVGDLVVTAPLPGLQAGRGVRVAVE